MNINFKTRAELKNFFKKNAIPTASNFADLIDAALNQKDDGLLKPAGEPLSLEASIAASKQAIRFYETFVGNTNPSWVVSLVKPGTNQSAFVLSDAAGTPRLSIEQTGAVNAPGAVTVGSLAAAGAITAAGITSTGLLSASAGANVTGAPLNVGTSAGTAQPLTVWGALTANSTANITGLLTATAGVTTTGAINTNTLTATGNISANGGLTVSAGKSLTANGPLAATAGINVTGAPLNVGTSLLTAQPLTVWGSITANGQINAGAGIVVSAAGSFGVLVGTQANPVALTTWGMTSAIGGLNAIGRLTANGGFDTRGTNGGLEFYRRNFPLGGGAATAAGDSFVWYSPDGVAKLWTPVNGDLMTIKSNGDIGFGISDPLFRLDVMGRMRLHAKTPSDTAGIWLAGVASSSTPINDRAFLGMKANEQVGFWGNTGTPNWRLFVDTTTGNLNISGAIATKVGGATTWATNSDARLKQNIGPLHNALERLLQLRGATYQWREPATQGNETGTQMGFIGQEVEKVFPEWILENDVGYKLLSIRGFEALAVEALRELRAANQALQHSHQELQAQIARLTARSPTTGGES